MGAVGSMEVGTPKEQCPSLGLACYSVREKASPFHQKQGQGRPGPGSRCTDRPRERAKRREPKPMSPNSSLICCPCVSC